MGQIINLVALASSLGVIYYIIKKFREHVQYKAAMRQHGCQPPRYYPHRDPLFGLDLMLDVKRSVERGQCIEDSHQRFEKYGHTFVTKAFGAKIINTIEPENLKAMLATDFKKWGFEPLRRDMVLSFMGKGIMNQDGEYWQHARALIRPSFERAHIANMGLFRKHVDRLIATIPTDGTTIDLQPLFKRYNLDTSSEFLFGQSVDSQLSERTEENETFIEAFEYISSNMGKMRHMNSIFFRGRDKRWDQAVEQVHAFVDARVSQAQEKVPTDAKIAPGMEFKKKRFVLLQEMAALTDNRLRLRHEILHVFMPSHESIGTLLSSTFHILARHPEVWNRLRAEVLESNPSEPTYDTIKNMTYLRHFLNEGIQSTLPLSLNCLLTLFSNSSSNALLCWCENCSSRDKASTRGWARWFIAYLHTEASSGYAGSASVAS